MTGPLRRAARILWDQHEQRVLSFCLVPVQVDSARSDQNRGGGYHRPKRFGWVSHRREFLQNAVDNAGANTVQTQPYYRGHS